MNKIGIDQAVWDTVVSEGAGVVGSLSEPVISGVNKTTLKRFKQIVAKQKKLAKTTASFKEVSQKDFQKMRQAGAKITSEDQQAAKSIQQNITVMKGQ